MKNEPMRAAQSRGRDGASKTLFDSTTIRLAALLGGHEWIKWRADLVGALAPSRHCNQFHFSDAASDKAYFHYRAVEERQAANIAVGSTSRKAHEGLAAQYAKLAAGGSKHPPQHTREKRDGARDEIAACRQERLLDAGLAETFPASDPVSISRIS